MKNVLGIQQGGHLGGDPAARVAAAPAGSPNAGSMQGGYLGLALAASPMPKRLAPASSFAMAPAAWCNYSADTDRCRGRAEPDHTWCMAHAPDHYASCRQTMDYIGWHL